MMHFETYKANYKDQVFDTLYDEKIYFKMKRPNDIKEESLDRLMEGAILVLNEQDIDGIFSISPHPADARIGKLEVAVTKNIDAEAFIRKVKANHLVTGYEYLSIEVATFDFDTIDMVRTLGLAHIATFYSDVYKGGMYYDKEVYTLDLTKDNEMRG